MKYPVLRVRKGVGHYDDNRPAEDHASTVERESEPSRRGRRRAPIFLPLLIVVLAIAAVLQVFSGRGGTGFADWDVRIRALPYIDVLLVTVTFTSRPGIAPSSHPPVRVRVLLPDTGASVELSGTLAPPATSLRGELPMTNAVRTLTAEITIGERRRTMSVGVNQTR